MALEPSLDPAAYAYAHAVRVRFAETDAMGVVHHAAYLPYLEEARVAFLGANGHPYADVRAGGLDIAVVEVAISYLRAARFGDDLEVALVLGAPRGASFQIAYLVRDAGEAVATAVTVHACLDAASGRAVRLPPWLATLARQGPLGAILRP